MADNWAEQMAALTAERLVVRKAGWMVDCSAVLLAETMAEKMVELSAATKAARWVGHSVGSMAAM